MGVKRRHLAKCAEESFKTREQKAPRPGVIAFALTKSRLLPTVVAMVAGLVSQLVIDEELANALVYYDGKV